MHRCGDPFEGFMGTWSGTGCWTTPNGKSRHYLDRRHVGGAPAASLRSRTSLTWGDSRTSPFYHELAIVSFSIDNQALRMQLLSPQGLSINLAGAFVDEPGCKVGLSFSGNSSPRDIDGFEMPGEQVDVTYRLHEDLMSWTFTSTSDFYGLTDQTYRFESTLRRGDPEEPAGSRADWSEG